ncbi:MAG TPA: chloride channel protein [Kaistiaceae bacterium]|nr:chloride channel protein [Kaistiaceae bacterium]
MRDFLIRQIDLVRNWVEPNLRTFMSGRQPLVWLLAIVIGLGTSAFAILFRLTIAATQLPWLGTFSENVWTMASAAPWWVIVAAPTVGGLAVGLFLQFVLPGMRAGGIADVIEARTRGGRGLGFWQGLGSALVSAVSLGSGASAGREGPVVHLGASVAAALCGAFSLPETTRRTLLACGVAGAVSASFNTPIAGVLFAHEVILGHYAMRAFVPIVLSSVTGTVLSRAWFGDIAAFKVPPYQITSYLEVPAFALLGLVAALVAVLFQFALMGTDRAASHVKLPLWQRPVLGGFIVGVMGVFAPQILGVGYEATNAALYNWLSLPVMLMLIFLKTGATAITLASRFGGGIVAPSLYVGAMTGGAFGLIAAAVVPDMASSQGLYAILGMGAVAAAVLGAPISTAVMVFELTGGYALTLALLLAISISTGLMLAIHGRSYFHWQLEMRGLVINEGPHRHLVRTVKVAAFTTPLGADGVLPDGIATATTLSPGDTLEKALRAFDECGGAPIPVVDPARPDEPVGYVEQVRALAYFNSTLIETSLEEHH